MNEEVEMIIEMVVDSMDKAVLHLEQTLLKIRAGKADPNILNGIMVEYYGATTPLNQMASVTVPDSKSLLIQPWDKQVISAIERAIMASNIGLMPNSMGDVIRINLPPLTEERRRDLVKQVKNETENAKVSIRTARRDGNEEIKKLKKDGLAEDIEKEAEEQIQQLTDKFVKKIDEVAAKKEKDIMTV